MANALQVSVIRLLRNEFVQLSMAGLFIWGLENGGVRHYLSVGVDYAWAVRRGWMVEMRGFAARGESNRPGRCVEDIMVE